MEPLPFLAGTPERVFWSLAGRGDLLLLYPSVSYFPRKFSTSADPWGRRGPRAGCKQALPGASTGCERPDG